MAKMALFSVIKWTCFHLTKTGTSVKRVTGSYFSINMVLTPVVYGLGWLPHILPDVAISHQKLV